MDSKSWRAVGRIKLRLSAEVALGGRAGWQQRRSGSYVKGCAMIRRGYSPAHSGAACVPRRHGVCVSQESPKGASLLCRSLAKPCPAANVRALLFQPGARTSASAPGRWASSPLSNRSPAMSVGELSSPMGAGNGDRVPFVRGGRALPRACRVPLHFVGPLSSPDGAKP